MNLAPSEVILVAVALTIAGCEAAAKHDPTPHEFGLIDQASMVQSGKSERIELTRTVVKDDDLAALGGLVYLRSYLHEFLIDDARSRVTAIGLAHLAGSSHLNHLRLRGSGCDDAALAEIARFHELRILNVPRGEFTDVGLASLASLMQLEQLRFGSPYVTDAGIKSLHALPELKRVHLIGAPLTDASLAELATIEQLESLYVDDIPFSDAAWDELFRTREKLGRPLHVHIDEAHHDRDPHRHEH